MYHVQLFAPIEYWKKLDQVLRAEVPILYEKAHENPSGLIASREQFNTAAMILNNVKLVPTDYSMELPSPNEERSYPQFEQSWTSHSPNAVIGPFDLKTCGNHRMQTLVENADFVAWRNPESIPIHTMVRGLPLENELIEFFAALDFFQSTIGTGVLDVYSYVIDGKVVRMCPRYVASADEYSHYWNEAANLFEKLNASRQEHFRCIWCYQTFSGLTAQGMSKGLVYSRPEHIPKAMNNLAIAIRFIHVPLEYICRAVIQWLGNPSPREALLKYTRMVEWIEVASREPGSESFETLLYKKDVELIEEATRLLNEDIAKQGTLNLEESEERERIKINAIKARASDVKILYGANGRVIKSDSLSFTDLLNNQKSNKRRKNFRNGSRNNTQTQEGRVSSSEGRQHTEHSKSSSGGRNRTSNTDLSHPWRSGEPRRGKLN